MALNFAKLPRAAQRAAFAHMDKGNGRGRFTGKLKVDKGKGRFSGTLPDEGRGKFAGTLPVEKRSKALGTGERHAELAAKTKSAPAGQKEIDDLRKAYEGGHTVEQRLSGGKTAVAVEKIKLSNGQAAVRKVADPRDTRVEYLSGRVANALGIKDVTVAQTGEGESIAKFVDGKPGGELLEQVFDDAANHGRPEAMALSLDAEIERQSKLNNGREIGMLDWLINNEDRHDLNWMVSPDGKSVIPIDHGMATFTDKHGVPTSPFIFEWVRAKAKPDGTISVDPQWSPEELRKIRASIEGLKGDFSSADEQRWHAFMLSRLEMLEGK